MSADGQSVLQLLFVLAGAVSIWANLWRALLFLTPRAVAVDVEDGTPDAPVPGWLEPTAELLRGLGFVSLGTFTERFRLGPTRTSWAFVHPEHRTWALVADSPLVRRGVSPLVPPEPRIDREGPAARVTFFTTSGSAFLLSSNFRRPGADVAGRHLAGGLPGAMADRLFRAHLRRIPEIGAGRAGASLDELLALVRDWHHGVGRAELRRQHAVGLLWTVGGLGMVAGPLVGRLWGST